MVEKGQILRIVDLQGCQAVDTLFYNAHDHGERYSAQDTTTPCRSSAIRQSIAV
ncbi:DUF1989 domain-containing protein [Hansschlegelia beijingensis]